MDWFETAFDDKPVDTIATFGEKYGAVVRVVDIGGYSKELCGGTHVRHTGEIGLCKIISESAVSAGTRRIEALAGNAVYDLLQTNFKSVNTMAHTLQCKTSELDGRLSDLLEQKAALERRIKGFERQTAAKQANQLVATAVKKKGIHWVAKVVQLDNPKDLKSLAVQTAKMLSEGVVVMGCEVAADKVSVVALCSPEAVRAGCDAGSIVQAICRQLGGKGGGKPDFAMGGGTEVDQLESALAKMIAD